MGCPRRGRSGQLDPADVLATLLVRHHTSLEHVDSPGCCCVIREPAGSQGSPDTPWCGGAEPSLPLCQQWGGQVLEERDSLQQGPYQVTRDKRASAGATTSYHGDKVIRTENFFWQGGAHGLGLGGVKLSIKPCQINLVCISGRIWNVNTHASRQKATTKCLVLKRNFLLSNFLPIFR